MYMFFDSAIVLAIQLFALIFFLIGLSLCESGFLILLLSLLSQVLLDFIRQINDDEGYIFIFSWIL